MPFPNCPIPNLNALYTYMTTAGCYQDIMGIHRVIEVSNGTQVRSSDGTWWKKNMNEVLLCWDMFSALVFKRACKAYSILVDSTSCKRSSHKGTNMASLVGSAASGSQKRLDESTYTCHKTVLSSFLLELCNFLSEGCCLFAMGCFIAKTRLICLIILIWCLC